MLPILNHGLAFVRQTDPMITTTWITEAITIHSLIIGITANLMQLFGLCLRTTSKKRLILMLAVNLAAISLLLNHKVIINLIMVIWPQVRSITMRDLLQGICYRMHVMRDTQTIMSGRLSFIQTHNGNMRIMLSLKHIGHITQCVLLL